VPVASPMRQGSPPVAPGLSPVAPTGDGANPPAIPAANLKEALLTEIKGKKAGFYNTVVAQAQRIEVTENRVAFVFATKQTMLKEWFEQQRAWLETAVQQLSGRKLAVVAIHADGGDASPAASSAAESAHQAVPEHGGKRDLKAEALSSTAVQAMLDVFPAEIRDVEEM
jgi:hypothetical protein